MYSSRQRPCGCWIDDVAIPSWFRLLAIWFVGCRRRWLLRRWLRRWASTEVNGHGTYDNARLYRRDRQLHNRRSISRTRQGRTGRGCLALRVRSSTAGAAHHGQNGAGVSDAEGADPTAKRSTALTMELAIPNADGTPDGTAEIISPTGILGCRPRVRSGSRTTLGLRKSPRLSLQIGPHNSRTEAASTVFTDSKRNALTMAGLC